ncbi:MAG: hypothetical protein IJT73_11175 [Selenomonadaceae bacterium]|nr:hypothetical protein [Selenomonadaceae bacterium]
MFDKKTVISTRFWAVFVASMVSMISAYILMLTDNVVAGQIVGDDAVAAMTLIFPIFTLILFVAYLISDGLAMMASYAQGRNDRAEVNRLFSLGLILSIGCSLIFFVALYFLREEILNFWEISPHLKFFANEYYSGIIFLVLFQFVSIFNYTIFFAEGMERACLIAAGAAFVVNVVLDIVLCQNLGVRGIGLATTFGTLASIFVQLYYLTGGRSQLHFNWYWSLKKTWQGIFYSFYHSVDTFCISILPVLLSMQVIANFGEEKIIIVTVAVNLLTLIIAVYTGLVDCLQPMVCQYHAENNLHSVIKTMRVGMFSTVAISLIMTAAGMIFADFLPAMFGVEDEILANEAAVAMRYFLICTTFLGCTLMLANYYIYIEKLNYGALIKILLLLILPSFGMLIGGQFSMNIFWLSVSGAFAAAYLLNFILTKSRAGLLMIDAENLSRQISYDIDATFAEVMALTKKIDAELTRRGVPDKIKNKIVLCVEEFGLHSAERAGDKIFQLEISILFGDKITLIIRDNGEPYDILKTANEGQFNFREFFIEGVTANFVKRNYNASGDENRVTLQF